MKTILTAIIFSMSFSASINAKELFTKAPEQASQFDFLIGEWTCLWYGYDKQGKEAEPIPCLWNAQYKFDNRMVSDDFIMKNQAGEIMYSGTTLRTFSVKENRWEFTYLASSLPSIWKPWHGNMHDNEMQMDTAGKDEQGEYIGKAKFFNISKNAFDWQSMNSYDAGKTWHKTGRIQVKRAEKI